MTEVELEVDVDTDRNEHATRQRRDLSATTQGTLLFAPQPPRSKEKSSGPKKQPTSSLTEARVILAACSIAQRDQAVR